ncbi:MAG: M20/M25/M40 family metallo-hydrolase, partial [Solobacterium sp.]|nr:M20/M25/M40 family metallo-hydrolase [Solobacterium sp.]
MSIVMIILCILLVLLAVILFRTMQFKPIPQPDVADLPAEIDEERAVENLQKLVQCATVSYYDRTKEDEAEFAKLLDLVPQLYPHVVSSCEKIDVYHRALLYRWPGKDSSEATVLMAHFDVVPVERDKWEKDPFAGIIEDGVLWGRGTLDTKFTFNGILMAADTLLAEGFVPEHDIYMAFSGGEETNGEGAVKIVEYLQEHDVKLSLVLDEGGAVVEDVFPGLSGQCALIGIAEKGMVNVRFDCDSA